MKIFPILSLLVLFTLASCGSDDDTKATESALTDLNNIVSAGDRRALVGKEVNLDNVPVDTIVGSYFFWAGDDHSAIPVFRKDKQEGAATVPVREGGHVRIQGTIRLAENVGAAEPMWEKINEQEKQDIVNAVVFIEAKAVQNID